MRARLMHLTAGLLLLVGPVVARAGEPAPAGTKPFSPYDFVVPTDRKIRAWEQKVRRNPNDAEALTQLARCHIHWARERGDHASYGQAETAARRALALCPDHALAQLTLAHVLCARHRFTEGLRLAQRVYRQQPREHHALVLVGDALLELGRYAEAEKTYQDLKQKDPLARLDSRLARLAELRGQTDEALRHMRQALVEEAALCITREERAWFPFRLGEMYWQAGRLAEASRHLEEALQLHPRYPLALAFLGRVRAAQGKADEAIRLYGQAVAVNAEVFMLADLGDLYARSGKAFLAKLNFDRLEKAARGQAAYARELSLFYANHGRNLPEALTLARQDLDSRPDVYAQDTLAWALFQNGQLKEAAEASAKALRLGTRDAAMHYHAGRIHQRLGDTAKAREHLALALAINPHFSLTQAEEACRILKALNGEGRAAR